jgi:type IV conjugative transfer system protein TraL
MEENKFPQYLSAPMQFMWFDSDTFFLMVIFITISMTFGGWSICLIVIGPLGYSQLKKRYSSSFLIHMLYFSGFKKLSHYPSFFENDFQE